MTTRAAALFLMLAVAAPAGSQTLRPPAGEPPGISPSLGAVSPQDLTEPNQIIECDASSVDGRSHRFSLRYHGRRGYLNPQTSEAEATDGRVAVVADGSRLFSSYNRWSSFQNRFEAHSDREDAPFGSHVRIQMERTDFERDSITRSTWAVLVQAYLGWMPLTKAVGFCRVESTPQQPLNQVEVREHMKRR